MKPKRFFYFLKEGLVACAKNKGMTLASITTAAVALFLLGASLLILTQLQGVIQGVEDQVIVSIFFKQGVDKTKVEIIKTRLSVFPGVEEVTLVDRKAALSSLLQELGSKVDLSEVLEENPLPHALKVKARDPVVLERIARKAQKYKSVDEVLYPKKIIQRLHHAFLISRTTAILTISFLVFAAIILIVNTIRLSVFARRKEIRIMQLVGATNWFIRVPFLVEGIVQGLGGALLSSFFLFLLYRFGLTRFHLSLPFLFSPLPLFVLQHTIALILLTGIAIGTIGSMIAVSSHLEEP